MQVLDFLCVLPKQANRKQKVKTVAYFQIKLLVLLLLTIVTLSTGTQTSLPQVAYAKAIDIWMLTCLFNVFAALCIIAVGRCPWTTAFLTFCDHKNCQKHYIFHSNKRDMDKSISDNL